MSKELSDKELCERELDFRIDRTQTEYLKEVSAQRKPLTDEQAKQIIAKQDWGREKISNHEHCLNIIRDVEAIYGIKGN